MARRRRRKLHIKANLSPEVAREVLAISLMALAILLILAMFGYGGILIEGLFTGLKVALGFAAYLLPVIFGLLSWMLFMPEKYEVSPLGFLSLAGIVISVAGLLHLSAEPDVAISLAQEGRGGGLIGYALSAGLRAVMGVGAGVIVLIAVVVICLVMVANARLSVMAKLVFGMFRRGNSEGLKINEPTGMSINTKLPIKGTLGGNEPVRTGDFEALTVGADPDWNPPSLELLESTTTKADAGNVKERASLIQQTLSSFGIDAQMGEVNVGPTVTQYTLKPSSGVKLNKITELDRNLALSLAAHPIRIEAPIPGKSAVGIEVPNKTSSLVRLKDLLASDELGEMKSALAFVLGRDVAGQPAIADLDKMPHLLIAGSTGSGKSVMINALLTALLYRNSPSDMKLILVDPKRVELSLYNDVPHLLTPVVTEPQMCISALKWLVAEMERRYKLFAELSKRNIAEYNMAKKEEAMPYIVIVIDELSDLMAVAASDVEALIVRLAQMARATGIHLVLATQRPSVNVITGLIKANIPARIAFTVASQVDSRTILDQMGAEKLLGKGDMLFISPEFIKPKRIQGVFISSKEAKAVADFLKKERAPQYNEEVLAQPVRMGGGRGVPGQMDNVDDDLFQEAADTVIRSGKASASLLQRRLRVGYARAARLLDLLEERGVVGPADGARPRDVLVDSTSDVLEEIDYGEQ